MDTKKVNGVVQIGKKMVKIENLVKIEKKPVNFEF